MDENDNIPQKLAHLNEVLAEFIDFFQQEYNYESMVYTHWNAKNILGHVTFWHESFARNISDLGTNQKPNPLKGKLSEVNQRSVETTQEVPIPHLITRLKEAQRTVEAHIFNENITLIPYKKGSRDYSRYEHLDIVARHITRHLKDLKKAF